MLSPLACVGHCSLAVGHGPSAGLPVGVPDRLPVSPLSSPRACSGAGPGWHGCGWIAASAVLSEGLAAGAVALVLAFALSAGPSPWWRIASGARLRRSRGYRAERGQPAGPRITAGVHMVKRQPAQTGPPAARVKLATRSSRESRWAATVMLTQSIGHWPAHSRQVAPQSDALPAIAIRPRRRGPGRRADADLDAGTGRPGISERSRLMTVRVTAQVLHARIVTV